MSRQSLSRPALINYYELRVRSPSPRVRLRRRLRPTSAPRSAINYSSVYQDNGTGSFQRNQHGPRVAVSCARSATRSSHARRRRRPTAASTACTEPGEPPLPPPEWRPEPSHLSCAATDPARTCSTRFHVLLVPMPEKRPSSCRTKKTSQGEMMMRLGNCYPFPDPRLSSMPPSWRSALRGSASSSACRARRWRRKSSCRSTVTR